jgi:hypothetical protein
LQLGASNIHNPSFNLEAMTIRLTDLGNQGWELVTNIDSTHYHGATKGTILIFKREKN